MEKVHPDGVKPNERNLDWTTEGTGRSYRLTYRAHTTSKCHVQSLVQGKDDMGRLRRKACFMYRAVIVAGSQNWPWSDRGQS